MRGSIPSGLLARFFSLLTAAALAACTSGPSGEARLRPGPQRLPHLQAQGDLVIAALKGVAITVQPLTPEGLDAYYSERPALLNPFKITPDTKQRPLAFIVRIQNQGQERVVFDPSQVQLADQRDRRTNAIPYDELYGTLSESEQSAKALQALQDTVFINLLVVPPKLDREGLLLFPPPDPEAKALILHMYSFYIGSAAQLLLFEFQVLRTP
ncbi:MAG: hypothetical protein L0191_19395 [Acidobacteria bacterium]|nr:hypothetical protein [Acidobacteriota bacterium]